MYVITFVIFTSFNQFGHGFNLIARAFAKYVNYVIKLAQLNNTQYNDIQHNDTQHIDIQHNDIQLSIKGFHVTLSIQDPHQNNATSLC